MPLAYDQLCEVYISKHQLQTIHHTRVLPMIQGHILRSLLSHERGYPSIFETLYVSFHIISETSAVRDVPWNLTLLKRVSQGTIPI